MCATSIHALRCSNSGNSPWRHGTRVGSRCWTRAMTSPHFLPVSLLVSVLFLWDHRSKIPNKEVVDVAAKLRSARPTCILAHGMLGHRSQNQCSVGLLHGRQYCLSCSKWSFMWLQIQTEAVPSCKCWKRSSTFSGYDTFFHILRDLSFKRTLFRWQAHCMGNWQRFTRKLTLQINIHTITHIYIDVHTYIYTYTHTYCICKRTYTHIYLRTNTHKYVRTNVHKHKRTYIQTVVHTNKYIHTYIYIHTTIHA